MKTLKKILSVIGATIVIVTFFVKEARTDKLKELGNSLETAQDTFNIENDENETGAAIGRLTNDFYQYASTPNRPLWKPEEVFHPGCPAIISTFMSIGEGQASLNIAARLVKKLPHDIGAQFDIQGMNREYSSALQAFVTPHAECRTRQLIPNIQNLQLPTEAEVIDLVKKAQPVTTKGSQLTQAILAAATEQLERDEDSAQTWTRRYYALYIFGWVITVIGILLGEDEDRNVVEDLTEG